MSTLTDRLFGTHSQREVKRILPLVKKINSLRDMMREKPDEEFKTITDTLKGRLARGESTDDILPEAFAAIREAARRTLGMEPFDVQLIGGVVLHQGRIAEMKTGEGKTLVAILPAYLNALEGKGSYVVTVNPYLTGRDAELMRPAYEFMGLTVGTVLPNMSQEERKRAYHSDITYVTNTELGFDYLRDNTAKAKERQVLNGLHYAIIDEADSILIDEARTPLILSGDGERDVEMIERTDAFIRTLERGTDEKEYTKFDYMVGELEEETGDFVVDEKNHQVSLTGEGVRKAEAYFHVENLGDPENAYIQHCVNQSLKAHHLYRKDRDYMVRDGEVFIVDPNTGRTMPGRRFSDGLHQMLEAKEQVEIKSENLTLASITYQSFFNKFTKKAGMTGTAATDEQEFRDIYFMDVVSIPTNRPVIRNDREDVIYRTEEQKHRAVVERVRQAYKEKRPVLVGTASIEASEELSTMFSGAGIPHRVLNARYDAYEAEIIAEAGKAGAVTIATNMAGRGTDIKLDKNAEKAGGLLVIGTERHESRRVDDQLRGRSGRQGDPGESQFYVSLNDRLFRLYGKSSFLQMLDHGLQAEDGAIEDKAVSKAIETAQKNVEGIHLQIRKSVTEYDKVIDEMRDAVYRERQGILDGNDMSDHYDRMLQDEAREIAEALDEEDGDKSVKKFDRAVRLILSLPEIRKMGIKEGDSFPELLASITGKEHASSDDIYTVLKNRLYGTTLNVGENNMRRISNYILLTVTDKYWSEIIDEIEALREMIRTERYAQRDPKVEFGIRVSKLYSTMCTMIRKDTISAIMEIYVENTEDNTMSVNADNQSGVVMTQQSLDMTKQNLVLPGLS